LKDHVRKVLAEKTPPKQLQEFLLRIQNLVKMSRDTMCPYYPIWDRNDMVYRGERRLDEADRKALGRGEPAKVIVPLSYSQVQTFVAFCSMLYTQRDYFYEMEGSGAEDEKAAQLGQAVVERDLEHNKFKGILLTQWLTDIGRFGIGILKSSWAPETCPQVVQVPDPAYVPQPGLPMPVQPPMIDQVQEVTKYLGNKIVSVSPYRWFPDTRLPITRYREGEFCADEVELSRAELEKMQERGEVEGLSEVPNVTADMLENRRPVAVSGANLITDPNLSKRFIIITEVQIRLNPAKTEIADGVFLDPEMDYEVVYMVWLANDSRIIKIEDGGYEHNEFTHDAAQFFNDQNRLINFGLSELLAPSQDVLDWLMNARITNVRKVIQNQLVVDPRYVEMQDLIARNPVLRLKSTATGLTIDSYIKQLNVVDVTTGHLQDMANVAGFAKEASGISENLLGQFASGRRSAREASAVNSNAAARLIVIAQGLWEGGLLPLGKKLIANIRQGLDVDQLVRVVGLTKVQEDPMSVQAFLPVNRSMLLGNYDFKVFNATLPSQRAQDAAGLQELLMALAKDSRLVMVFGIDPKLLLLKILELRNIQNVEQYRLTPQRAQELMLLAGLAGNPANAGGPPGGGQGQPIPA
jgi:hypothetical protein